MLLPPLLWQRRAVHAWDHPTNVQFVNNELSTRVDLNLSVSIFHLC